MGLSGSSCIQQLLGSHVRVTSVSPCVSWHRRRYLFCFLFFCFVFSVLVFCSAFYIPIVLEPGLIYW